MVRGGGGWVGGSGRGPSLLRRGEKRLRLCHATARGPLAGFMRLTPGSRAPAKADPSARAGFEFDPGGSHLGRGCAYLGLGWRHLGGFTKLLLLWLWLSLSSMFFVVVVVLVFFVVVVVVVVVGVVLLLLLVVVVVLLLLVVVLLLLLLLLLLVLVLLLLVLVLLLLLTDVGPIWAQVCPCLGPRLLLLLLSLSSLFFVVVVFGRRFAPVLALGCGCCCCWPMLALFGRSFAPVLALGWPM